MKTVEPSKLFLLSLFVLILFFNPYKSSKAIENNSYLSSEIEAGNASDPNAVGIRDELPPAFLHWPLPNHIGIEDITSLPDTPWTHAFLGVIDCPAHPAKIEDNDHLILDGVPNERVQWNRKTANFSCYGRNGNYPDHGGTDFFADIGTPVYAAANADQLGVRLDNTDAPRVWLRHLINGEYWYTFYAHLSASTYPVNPDNPRSDRIYNNLWC